MKRFTLHAALLGTLVLAVGGGSYALAGSGDGVVDSEPLNGYNEVPAVSTTATGGFGAVIEGNTIRYTLTYSALEAPVTQAHIHFGQRFVAAGVSVFLCSNGAVPPGTPTPQACPPGPTTITGTLTPADVIGPAGQGIAPGEFAELVAALRAGLTYVNVHSTKFPAGEIRAQLDSVSEGERENEDDDDRGDDD